MRKDFRLRTDEGYLLKLYIHQGELNMVVDWGDNMLMSDGLNKKQVTRLAKALTKFAEGMK